MMATADIRAKRIELEYQSVRGVQNDILDRVDGFEAAMLGLNEAVAENRGRLERVEVVVTENRELILANSQRLDDLTEKIDRLMKHLDVPPKRGMGFLRDEASNGQG